MEKYIKEDGPYIKSNNTYNKIMIDLIISLIPIILLYIYENISAIYNDSKGLNMLLRPFIFIILAPLITYLTELIYAKIVYKTSYKNYIKNSYAFYPGLLIALLLPINTPIYLLIIGCILSTLIGKVLFGGYGKNILNQSLLGILFIILTFNIFNGYNMNMSNTTTYISIILCIISYIYLCIKKSIKWKVPIVFIAEVIILGLILNFHNCYNIKELLLEILSGNIMLYAVFIAPDNVSSPVTNFGQVLYGLFLGLLTVTFRYFGSFDYATVMSILTVNIFVFIFDYIGISKKNIKLLSILVFLILLILLIIKI